MILYINTISTEDILLALQEGRDVLVRKKISAPRRQAEKLLPGIAALLKKQKVNLNELEKIVVANQGGSFTSLRIGVITANALAYGLGIPVESENKNKKNLKKFGSHCLVEPVYDHEPNIGMAKKPLF